jgi:uncharacterized protein (TIGR03083 family)
MPGPTANNEAVVDHLAQVWVSLVGACEGVSPAQWELATDCPGWTVKDQLSHLIGVERLLLGDPSPPPPAVFPEYVTNAFGELNEAWVDARRATPGHQVLEEFIETTNRRSEALRSLPKTKFDEVGWSPIGQVPYREFMETRVIDSWAHEQDVRRALGRPGGRNGVGEATTLDRCERAMPFVVGKQVAPPDGTTVLFAVGGVLGRKAQVKVDQGRASPVPSERDEAPTVRLRMDQEAFWRLCFGRTTGPRVLATGEVQIEGDIALGHKVVESMAFMI